MGDRVELGAQGDQRENEPSGFRIFYGQPARCLATAGKVECPGRSSSARVGPFVLTPYFLPGPWVRRTNHGCK